MRYFSVLGSRKVINYIYKLLERKREKGEKSQEIKV